MEKTSKPSVQRSVLTALTSCAIFAVGACGGANTSGPAVLRISGTSGESSFAGDAAPNVANESAQSSLDSKMMAPYYLTFEVTGTLPELDGDARAYTLKAGSVSPKNLSRLQSVFGVDGKVVTQPVNQGGGQTIGSFDGSSDSIWISGDAMHYWSYSRAMTPVSYPVMTCSETIPVPTPAPDVATGDKDGSQTSIDSGCATPTMEPPVNVPSKKEAEKIFLATVADLGYQSSDFLLETWADTWGASVTGYLLIDGVRTQMATSIFFGENGVINYASGVLIDVEKGDNYPRIGTTAGLIRLNEQQSSMWGGPLMRDTGDIAVPAVGAPVGTNPTVETIPGAGDPSVDGTDSIAIGEPVPGYPQEYPMQTQTMSIVGVEEELQTLYGVDGTIYLVPGYVFLGASQDGYTPRWSVSAMPDEYVQQAEVIVDPTGVTDPPVVVVDPPVVVETTVVVEMTIPIDPPIESLSVSQIQADTLLGLSEDEAMVAVESNGWIGRIVARDDEKFAVTEDYRTNRVNLSIEADVVIGVSVG